MLAVVALAAVVVQVSRADPAPGQGSGPGQVSGPPATGQRYATFTFARGMLQEAVDCRPAPGTVSTLEVADWMATRGVSGSSNLVPSRLDAGRAEPSGHWCGANGRHTYLSWEEAALLRDRYGWQHSTSGLDYEPLIGLPVDEQRRQACGSLERLRAEGHLRGNGLFAAPAPRDSPSLDDQVMRDAVIPCGYAWGRDYGRATASRAPERADGTRIRANVRADMHPGGYSRTVSVSGGSCPSAWDTCGTGATKDYVRPGQLVADLRDAPPDSHVVLQFYRLAVGDVPGSHTCSGPPATHQTYAAELYCLVDLQEVVDALPEDTVATDPLTVAQAWGVPRA